MVYLQEIIHFTSELEVTLCRNQVNFLETRRYFSKSADNSIILLRTAIAPLSINFYGELMLTDGFLSKKSGYSRQNPTKEMPEHCFSTDAKKAYRIGKPDFRRRNAKNIGAFFVLKENLSDTEIFASPKSAKLVA